MKVSRHQLLVVRAALHEAIENGENLIQGMAHIRRDETTREVRKRVRATIRKYKRLRQQVERSLTCQSNKSS